MLITLLWVNNVFHTVVYSIFMLRSSLKFITPVYEPRKYGVSGCCLDYQVQLTVVDMSPDKVVTDKMP